MMDWNSLRKFVANVLFPIIACVWMGTRLESRLEGMEKAMRELTIELRTHIINGNGK
jgi:hypothetical protein